MMPHDTNLLKYYVKEECGKYKSWNDGSDER